MMESLPQNTPWWTEFELTADEGARFQLGPLELVIFRSENEWQFAHSMTGVEDRIGKAWSCEKLASLPPNLPNLERFASGTDGDSIKIEPRVADRPVVARPRTPLHLLPGQHTKVYVSSPVWVEILVGQQARAVRELPVKRLSDTWIGANTRQGEVGYALKTYARSGVDEIQVRDHRVVTPVVVHNRAEDLLLVERMNLPTTYLSIYHNAKNELWTETVTLSHQEGLGMASLDLKSGPPTEAGEASRLTRPRRIIEENRLVRAFGDILKTLGEENSS